MSTPRPPQDLTERLLRKLEREGHLIPRPAAADATAVATPPAPDDEAAPPVVHDVPGLPRPRVPDLTAGEPTLTTPTPPPRTRPKAPAPQKDLTEQLLDLARSIHGDVEALGRVAVQGATGRAGPGEATARTGAALAGLEPEEVFPEVRAKPGDVGKAVRVLGAAALPEATAAQLAFGTILRSRAGEPSPLAASYERGVAPDAFSERHPGLALLADVATPGGGAGEAAKIAAGAGKRIAAKLGEKELTKAAEEAALRPGRASIPAVATLAGGGAGAAVGGAVGDTPEERIRNAAVGGLTGAALVGGGAAVAARAGREAESAATRALDSAIDEDGVYLTVIGEGRKPTAPLPEAPPQASGVKAGDYVNLAQFALDPSGTKRLAEEVTRVVEREKFSRKAVVTWEETKAQANRIARQLGLDPTDVQLDPKRRLSGAEMLALRNVVRSNVEVIERETKRLAADPSLTEAEREIAARAISAAERQNDALLARLIRAQSQTGRDLNALKILANSTLDPVVWFAKAKRQLGDSPLTDEIRATIQGFITDNDRAGLAKYVQSLRRPGLGEKVASVWKAGLLSRPTTHIANVLGNTSMAMLETAKDVPAFLFDRLLSAATALASGGTVREVTKGRPGLSLVTASLKGAREGIREAGQVMRGVRLDNALAKYDLAHGEIQFDNAILNTYVHTIFRALSAADRVFRGAALRRSLEEQARVYAKKAGVSVSEVLKAPSDEMVMRALADAELAVFQNRGLLARMASGLKRPARRMGGLAEVAAEVVAPFVTTPGNIVERAIEYSPWGGLSTAPDLVRLVNKAAKGTPDFDLQRKIAERLGRSSVGAAAILTGYLLAKNGRLSTGRPVSRGERDQAALEGRQENAILVDGKWRSISRVSPLSNLLLLGGTLYEAADKGLSPLETAGAAAAGLGKTVTEQSFLRGVQESLESVQDPEGAAAQQVRNTVASVVPAAVAATAYGLDPYVRETGSITSALLARVPVASRSLAPRLDQFGRPIRRSQGVLGSLFDPTSPRTDRRAHDPLVAELAENDVNLTQLQKRPGEDDAAFRERQAGEGRYLRAALEATVRSEEYRGAEEWAKEALQEHAERLVGYTIPELVRWRRRQMLEAAIRRARSAYTRATN